MAFDENENAREKGEREARGGSSLSSGVAEVEGSRKWIFSPVLPVLRGSQRWRAYGEMIGGSGRHVI